MGILGALAGVPAAQPQGGKVNWLGVLADALAGAAGRQGPYATMLEQQRQADLEDQRYQHRQDAEMEAQKSLYLWKQQHPDAPQPDEYERALAAAGITPGTPAYVEHMNNYIRMKENPVWTYTDPATGALMMGSKGPPQPEVLTTLPQGAKPIGGPSPSGSGGFR